MWMLPKCSKVFSDENMIRIFRLLPKDDAADIFAYMSSDRDMR